MPSSNRVLSLALLSTLWSSSSAFSVSPSNNVRSSVDMSLVKSDGELSRRDALVGAFGVASVLVSTTPNAVWAAGKPPSKEELERIKVGYEQLTYLLANFEQETTVCRENGGQCKRDADPVRRYMGLRSTTDPLFQIEKVFAKVKNMDLDPDKLEDFFEATEDWNTAMNMSNSMAFISQFGEYNPGGGVDEVLKYLEEAKIQVVLAQKALKTIMACLEIE
mmetsp:Transcript_9588/g.12478  ORF Transcript_9588/g.12478 Transcript_9588/m.12478 type:complete len:220 (-) Transcript_9588:139-798(-)|eukprot:CAMPEP_0195265476 /NCGR_PEP_ID=MMETSP0706-20130129/11442_1 /TAXON_ID=33640 /ORGANISM="Asterionellopsis glacialis, Strain CCMP134" /LENGTH=219 /DNA_ID=CAMNT_0040319893 /DNA_START=68 /DNA_END=727 /DNA_ORIENTATION=+